MTISHSKIFHFKTFEHFVRDKTRLHKTGLFFAQSRAYNFRMIQRCAGLLFTCWVLSGCSLYSSAGRKQFEEKAPASVDQAVSLSGCRNLTSGEAWLKEEFPPRENELIEMNSDYEVWLRSHEAAPWEVTVLTKHDSDNGDAAQICTYEFAGHDAWLTHRKDFLGKLSNSLVDLN